MIHVHVGKNAGDGQRVGDVILAAAANLAEVGLFGEEVGPFYVVGLLGIEITAERGVEGIDGLHDFRLRPSDVPAGVTGPRWPP